MAAANPTAGHLHAKKQYSIHGETDAAKQFHKELSPQEQVKLRERKKAKEEMERQNGTKNGKAERQKDCPPVAPEVLSTTVLDRVSVLYSNYSR